MVIQIRPRKKKLTLRRRHLGSSPLREVWGQSLLELASRLILRIKNEEEESEADDPKDYLRRVHRLRLSVIGISSDMLLSPLPKIHRTRIRINDLVDAHIPGLFRFNDKAQLLRLCAAFQFPPFFIAQNGLRFTCEEVLLCGLYRLHFPNTFAHEGWKHLFGFCDKRASECFKIFIQFMAYNWAYLVCDHTDFWLPYLPLFVNKITERKCRY
jgi:hypothetical protein